MKRLLIAALLLCAVPALAQVAGQLDLTVQQGSTFAVQLAFLDSSDAAVDLTGYTATAQVRSTYSATSALVTFTCDFATDRTTGILTLRLTKTQTTALTAPANAVWDLLLTNAGSESFRVLQGNVRITPAVTR